MPTTPRGLVYPASTDAPDVPADMQALAESIEAVFDGQPFCWVQHNATLNHAVSGTWYRTPFDTENSDAYGMHASNAATIVAPEPGLYVWQANCGFASNATGLRALMVRKNSGNSATGGTGLSHQQINALSSAATTMGASGIVYMAAGDYLDMWTQQTSGGALASFASTSSVPYQSLSLARFA